MRCCQIESEPNTVNSVCYTLTASRFSEILSRTCFNDVKSSEPSLSWQCNLFRRGSRPWQYQSQTLLKVWRTPLRDLNPPREIHSACQTLPLLVYILQWLAASVMSHWEERLCSSSISIPPPPPLVPQWFSGATDSCRSLMESRADARLNVSR